MTSYLNIFIKSSHFNKIIVLVIVFFSLFLHLVNLDADPPYNFAQNDIGLRVDEGYKTLAARNLVLFGSQVWSEADEYSGWGDSSPLTQGIMYIGFSVGEPNLITARTTALIYFLLLLTVVCWGEIRNLTTRNLVIVLCLLSIEPFLFFFSRAALFEVAMAAFSTLGLVIIRKLEKNPWLVLAAFFLCAFLSFKLIKISALLYFFPGLAVLALYAVSKFGLRKALMIVFLSIVVVGLMMLATQDIWARRMVVPPLKMILTRFLTNSFVQESPWVFSGALLCAFDLIRMRGKALLRDPYFLALISTVVGVPFLLTFFSYAPARYYVAPVPAYILIVAYWLKSKNEESAEENDQNVFTVPGLLFLIFALFAAGWTAVNLILPFIPIPQGDAPGLSASGAFKYLLPLVTLLVLFVRSWPYLRKKTNKLLKPLIYMSLCFAFVHGGWQASSIWFFPSYNGQKIKEALSLKVPGNAVLIGDFAPFFALGSHMPAIYSSTNRNNGSVIFDLCPDYFIDSGTRHDNFTLASYQDLGVQFEPPAYLGEYAGQRIQLLRIQYPDQRCGH